MEKKGVGSWGMWVALALVFFILLFFVIKHLLGKLTG